MLNNTFLLTSVIGFSTMLIGVDNYEITPTQRSIRYDESKPHHP